MHIEVAKVDVYKMQFFSIRGWSNVEIMINITSTPLILSVHTISTTETQYSLRKTVWVKSA